MRASASARTKSRGSSTTSTKPTKAASSASRAQVSDFLSQRALRKFWEGRSRCSRSAASARRSPSTCRSKAATSRQEKRRLQLRIVRLDQLRTRDSVQQLHVEDLLHDPFEAEKSGE